MRHNFFITLNENELGELAQLDGEAIAAYLYIKRNTEFDIAQSRVIAYGALAAYRGYGDNALEKAKRIVQKLKKVGLLEETETRQVFLLPFAHKKEQRQQPQKKSDYNNSTKTQKHSTETNYLSSINFIEGEEVKPLNTDTTSSSAEPLTEVQRLAKDLKERLVLRRWQFANVENPKNEGFLNSAAEWILKHQKTTAEIDAMLDSIETEKGSSVRVLDLCLKQNEASKKISSGGDNKRKGLSWL